MKEKDIIAAPPATRTYTTFSKNGLRVESWYDRKTRNWITQIKNSSGDQIGDAFYDYNIKGRDCSIKAAVSDIESGRATKYIKD